MSVPHPHDHGLAFDLDADMRRRRVLRLLGTAGLGVSFGALLAGCDYAAFGQSEPNRMATGADGAVCVKHPVETNGPFPADGTNSKAGSTVNVLDQTGVIRADMRTSFGGATAVADGVPLEVTVTLVDVGKACAPLAGHVLYLWHCDAAGKYSLYDLPDVNYLRAAGVTDAKGQAKFTTIIPGCYQGRWPHVHFEVFASPERAVTGKDSLLVSQFALSAEVCQAAYAALPVYASSIGTLAKTRPFEKDMIFADNTPEQRAAQMLKVDGNAATGLRGSVTVGIVSA